MRTLHRNKRPLYLCQKYKSGDLVLYKEPIKLYENYQVTSSEADLISMGIESYIYIRIKTDLDHRKYYHLGDRVYINVEPPETHDALCKTADYEVCVTPIPTLNECEVLLKKLSGRDEQ